MQIKESGKRLSEITKVGVSLYLPVSAQYSNTPRFPFFLHFSPAERLVFSAFYWLFLSSSFSFRTMLTLMVVLCSPNQYFNRGERKGGGKHLNRLLWVQKPHAALNQQHRDSQDLKCWLFSTLKHLCELRHVFGKHSVLKKPCSWRSKRMLRAHFLSWNPFHIVPEEEKWRMMCLARPPLWLGHICNDLPLVGSVRDGSWLIKLKRSGRKISTQPRNSSLFPAAQGIWIVILLEGGERDAVVIGINVYFFGFSRVFLGGNKRGIIFSIFWNFDRDRRVGLLFDKRSPYHHLS